MKNKSALKMISLSVVFAIVLSFFGFANVSVVSSAPIPSILITELMPNPSTGISTGDGFEYIEIYNNGTSSINLSGYRLLYKNENTGNAIATWDLSSSFTVAAESTAVIWVRASNNTSLTRNDFRSHYGLTSTELPDSKIYLLSLIDTGMGNTDWRSITIETDGGTDVARAKYNSSTSGTTVDARSGRSVNYTYPTDSTINMKKLQHNQDATPGRQVAYQVPNGKELLITEIMVNSTAGIGNGDAFEYVEVSNKSTSPVDLQDYRVTYTPTNPVSWDIADHLWMEPGSTAVIWVRPGNSTGANTALTKNDFRSHYGLTTTALPDSKLVIVSPAGTAMGNSGLRDVAIERDESGEPVSKVQYNVASADEDGGAAMEGKSITYKYPFAGTDPLMMRKIAGNQTPSPGTVSTGTQVPAAEQQGTFHFFGNLHSHTGYSDGASGSTPQTAMEFARDNGGADFFAVTDHSHYFNTLSSDGKVKWDEMHRMANLVNDDDTFVAIAGFEMTWAASQGRSGHMNTFLTDWYVNRNDNMPGTTDYWTTAAYYNKLKEAGNEYSITQFNHPTDYWGDMDDFDNHDAGIDGLVKLLELNGSSEHNANYTRALDKGWHVAAASNQDNHSADWITRNEERLVVVAPRNTRNDLFQAIRERRAYSSQDKNVEVSYKANGSWMGSILNNPASLAIDVDVYDPNSSDTVASMDIIADGGTVVASWSGTASNSVKWSTTLTTKYNYYYVKIVQTDGQIITTAPIWSGGTTIGSTYGIPRMEYTTGSTISIGATVSNPTGASLSNVLVEFYKNSITAANKIGQTTVATVPAAGTARAELSGWTPPASGGYRLLAQATIPIGSVNRAFVGYAEVPELLATELAPTNGAPAYSATNPTGTTDPYEFVELYNNSNASLNLQGYKLVYDAAAGGDNSTLTWDITGSKTIASKGTMVVWLKTPASAGKTLTDFNTKYGTSLTSSQVIELSADEGINNTNTNRNLYIMKDNGTLVSRTILNRAGDVNTGVDMVANKSINYEYPKNGSPDMLKKAANQTPTPGTVASGQTAGSTLP
jgi:hypothetical protein